MRSCLLDSTNRWISFTGRVCEVGVEAIAKNWNLESIDDQGQLFQPTWTDSRFAPELINFLIGRLTGQTRISLKMAPNYPARHLISIYLNERKKEFEFFNDNVVLDAENLSEAQQLASLVELGSYSAFGKVYQRQFRTKEEAEEEIENLGEMNTTIYYVLGEVKPWTVSVQVGFRDVDPLD